MIISSVIQTTPFWMSIIYFAYAEESFFFARVSMKSGELQRFQKLEELPWIGVCSCCMSSPWGWNIRLGLLMDMTIWLLGDLLLLGAFPIPSYIKNFWMKWLSCFETEWFSLEVISCCWSWIPMTLSFVWNLFGVICASI